MNASGAPVHPRWLVDGWAADSAGRHWLIQWVVFDSAGREPRLVCFRNGERRTFGLSEVDVDV